MTKQIILTVLLIQGLITSVKAEIDVCNSRGQFSEIDVWNLFYFSSFEIGFTLSIGSLSVLAVIVSLLTWIHFPSFSMPSDVIFVILLGTLLDNVTLIIQAIYSQVNSALPSTFLPFCSSIGFLNLLGNLVVLYYNALFCGALAYSIHNTIYKPYFSMLKLHLICLSVIVTGLLIVIFTADTDDPFSHLCIYRLANPSSLGLFFLHLIITIFTWYSLNKFRNKIPENSFFQKFSHFKYYYHYMMTFFLVEAANTLLYLIGNLSCLTGANNIQTILTTILTISHCITILLAFASAVLRLGHPFIRQKLKKSLQERQLPYHQYENQKEQFNWVTSLVDSIKGCQVLSFIEAIMINYIEHTKKIPKDLTPYHFQRQYSFVIDEIVTEEYTKRRITNRDSHFARRMSDGLTTLKYQAQIYTPEFYSWMFRTEKMNLFSSFDLRKNLTSVKDDSFTDGGKSGEFFFGTYDHKFIFKTIQAQQAQVLLTKTEEFYNYFLKHPDTLLIKILGLYRFERKDIKNQVIYLIIMKNLTMAHKSSNIRVYDIKGSAFNRSTIKQKKLEADDQGKLRRFTLKDKDFKAIEKKINIDISDAMNLKKILIRDIRFLSSLGVMDYSLLIVKREGVKTFQRGQFQSLQNPQILYHFGIIDYLEQWTVKRKAERVFKTLITKQQVTANSPEAYSERLIALIEEII